MNRQTVGAISTELQKNQSGSFNPQEIQKATEQEYLDNLIWAVQHARKKIDCSSIPGHQECLKREAFDGDFYVTALLKKEKLLENVLRNYFIPTISCPTPFYDQSVYKYHHAKEEIEFLWVIPDKQTCEVFKENKNIIVLQEQGLLQFVLSYYDGTLFRLMKKLNGETEYAGNALEGKELWQSQRV